jgi:hypothetical protein
MRGVPGLRHWMLAAALLFVMGLVLPIVAAFV